MSTSQLRELARINRLITLQAQLKYYEQTSEFYNQGVEAFKQYLECVRDFQMPRELINGYLRMAQYCENMEDLLFSRDLYREAMDLMIMFRVGTEGHLKHLRDKIESMGPYYY